MRRIGWGIAAALVSTPVGLAQTPADKRAEVVEALADALQQDYVYPAIGKQYADVLRGKAHDPAYAAGDDFEFAQRVTEDLVAVKADKHLRLLAPLPPAGAGGPRIIRSAGPGPGMKAVESSEKLTPDIAYIRFGVFPGDPETMADVEQFLAANAGVKTLIVDVRGNRGGGMSEMDLMFSDLFTSSVDLVQMETTQSAAAKLPGMFVEGPTFRTLEAPPGRVLLQHFVSPSEHPRLANTKLYVLQSGFSGSAAEHFLLALKISGRSTRVGETSAGAGHFGFSKELPNGFSTFVPVGRTFDPATGWDWEANGVPPDVEVPAAEALVWALKDAGLSDAEARAIDTRVDFVPPKPRPAGAGPVTVRVPSSG
ncbi:MAG: S41 family peptidase [Hyphomonadaceae bacterium]